MCRWRVNPHPPNDMLKTYWRTVVMEIVVEREQMEEFSALRELAYQALRHGIHAKQLGTRQICQLLVLPSFSNPVCWDVTEGGPRKVVGETRLYRSTWRMDLDSQALSSPVERLKHPREYKPTLETQWVSINKGELEVELARINDIRIPLAVSSSAIGIDGTSFELSFGDSFGCARIRWWCELPDDWRELRPVINDLESLFASAWKRGRRH